MRPPQPKGWGFSLTLRPKPLPVRQAGRTESSRRPPFIPASKGGLSGAGVNKRSLIYNHFTVLSYYQELPYGRADFLFLLCST